MITTYEAVVTPLRGLFKVSELYRDNKIKSNSVRQRMIIKLLWENSIREKDIKERLKGISL